MIDLHTHSTASDGTVSPADLARAAREAGLKAVALTDHDTVAGVVPFLASCAANRVEGVAGVELSTSWYGASLHIIGLFVNPACDELLDFLVEVRRNRQVRNESMVARLKHAGIDITMDELVAESGGEFVGRPHFAALLVEKGVCADRGDAFSVWLGRNCKGYVRRHLPLPGDAIDIIHRAGGKAIMAHPFGNPDGTPLARVRKTLKQLTALGLDGIEAHYSDHNTTETAHCLALAAQFGLLVSGGSDFHGETMPGIALGTGRGNLQVPDGLLTPLRQ